MTLQQLLYFREVSNTLSYTRAAENLFITQSSLSHAIHDLEDDLGAPLFYRRGGKRIQLTTYGEAFLPYVNRILDTTAQARDTISAMLGHNNGVVTIGYSHANDDGIINIISKALSEDKNINAALRYVVNHETRSFEEMLVNGSIDLAISAWPFAESRMVHHCKISTQKQYVLVNKNCILSKKETITPSALEGETIILCSGPYGRSDYVRKLISNNGIQVNYIDGISDWSVICRMITNGEGISIFPNLGYDRENIAYIELIDCENTRELYLLWPANRKISSNAEAAKKIILTLSDNYNSV